jgi:hypothetical protein
VTWTVSNTGNTTAAFNVNLFLANATLPAALKTQLILYKVYQTPVLDPNGCDLRVETRNQLLLNAINPVFVTPGASVPDQNSPSGSNATLWLAPGERARVTLRVFDNDRSNNVIVRNPDGTTASIDPALNPAAVLTAGVAAQAVDVGLEPLDPPGTTVPPIITPRTWSASGVGTVSTLNNGSTGTPAMQYEHIGNTGSWEFTTVAASGGTINLPYTWDGFHSYFQVTARLEVFVRRGEVETVVSLLTAGPTNCEPCTPPSGGFVYSGTTTVTVGAGDTFGFRLHGSHFDSANLLRGTFTVGLAEVPALAAATTGTVKAGQVAVVRGEGMPATGAGGALGHSALRALKRGAP